jgi:hypothetical protein
MSSFYRMVPKEELQDPTKFHCWAASLISWLSVTPQSPLSYLITTQEDAIKSYGAFISESNNGGMTKIMLEFLTAGANMDVLVFEPGSNLSPAFLHEKLKNKSHIYFVYSNSRQHLLGHGHVIVIYGISNPHGSNCTLGIMDPMPNQGIRPAVSWKENFGKNLRYAVVCWSRQ